MAIILDKTQESGIVAQYHRILRANVDYRNQTALVEIGSYLNKQCRDDGKNPVMIYTFNLSGEGLMGEGDLRAIIYSVLAGEGQEFAGGTQG